MNDLQELIKESQNNEYRNDNLISMIQSRLDELRRQYNELDKKCAVYENAKNDGKLTLEGKKALNKLYTEMKPIADEYNYLLSVLKEEKNKKVKEEKVEKVEKPYLNPLPSGVYSDTGIINSEDEITEKKKQKKTNRVWTSVVAIIAACSLLLGACIGKRNANNKEKTNNRPGYTQVSDANVVKSDVTKAIDSLKENQKSVWTRINAFQNYFNNIAAPTVEIEEDNGNRLFLTGEECVALYANLNAYEYTASELADLFGADSSYFISTNMNEKFIMASRVLNYYYATATRSSGLNILFNNSDDAKLFKEYESLLLKYNMEQTEENEKALHDYLMNLYLDGSLENAKAEHPTVLGVIGIGTTPILYAKGVINTEEMAKINEIYESVICDKIFPRVKVATEVVAETENQKVLEVLPSLLDKQNIKVSSRDINFEARNIPMPGNKGHWNASAEVASSETSTKQVTRDEAIDEFGEDAVAKAEEDAKNEVEKNNGSQLDYLQGLEDAINSGLYDDIYDQILEDGSYDPNVDLPTSGNFSHDAGVNDASDIIIEHAVEDATVEHNIDQVLPQDDYYVDDGALDDGFALMLK